MSESLIVRTHADGVTTLRMNDPRRLNGWTEPMIEAMQAAFAAEAANPDTKALVFTGTDPYYCAGVNLGATLRLGHPKALHRMIVERNQALFETFINFPKPILIAANGPAIGACVTSATLCDAIIASEKATFSTPFAKLGVPPEGCSSVVFSRRLGAAAQRILGPEGWKPDAHEAKAIDLVQAVVPHETLMDAAHAMAREWVEAGAERSYRNGMTREELLEINARESIQVADAFLGPEFLMGQCRFLWGKGKRQPALMFLGLRLTHPLWSKLL